MKSKILEQSAVMRNIGLHSDIKAMQADEDRARKLGKRIRRRARADAQARAQPARSARSSTRIDKNDKALDKPFVQALGLATSFRNDEAANVLMTQIDPIEQAHAGRPHEADRHPAEGERRGRARRHQ